MPRPTEIAVLTVNGQKYSAWESFWLRRAFGAACSDFSFTAVEDISSAGKFQEWRIQPGDDCTITLAGVLALTGYINVRQGAFTAKAHAVQFQGRSNTADPVDSSAVLKGGQLKGYGFEAIAKKLLEPHGVGLVVDSMVPGIADAFKSFSVRVGETAHMAIERLGRMRGLRLTDNAQGQLVAAGPPQGGSVGSLVEGRNLIDGQSTIDISNQYSKWNVRGSQQGNGKTSAEEARDVSASAENLDPRIRKNRVKLLMMEEPGTGQDASRRAAHEAAFSGNAIINCKVTVQGWLVDDSTLWDVNKPYFVSSPMLDLERTLVSQVITYSQSEEGTFTRIELCTQESAAYASKGFGPSPPQSVQGDPSYSGQTPSEPAKPDPADH